MKFVDFSLSSHLYYGLALSGVFIHIQKCIFISVENFELVLHFHKIDLYDLLFL